MRMLRSEAGQGVKNGLARDRRGGCYCAARANRDEARGRKRSALMRCGGVSASPGDASLWGASSRIRVSSGLRCQPCLTAKRGLSLERLALVHPSHRFQQCIQRSAKERGLLFPDGRTPPRRDTPTLTRPGASTSMARERPWRLFRVSAGTLTGTEPARIDEAHGNASSTRRCLALKHDPGLGRPQKRLCVARDSLHRIARDPLCRIALR